MKRALAILAACIVSIPSAFAAEIPDANTKEAGPDRPEATVTNPNYPLLNKVNANVSFVTNYIFRGISQTRNLPAIQGGLLYNFPLGIYANVWGSNVKFDGTDATVEIDGILGIAGEYGDNFAYDVNFGRYFYPSARSLEYNEFNTLFNYYFLQFGVSYSANVYNTHKSGIYYVGGINYDIPPKYIYGVCDLNFNALYGHYSLPRAGGNSYSDYLVKLSKKFDHYTLAVQWTSTNGRQKSSPIDMSNITGIVSADF